MLPPTFCFCLRRRKFPLAGCRNRNQDVIRRWCRIIFGETGEASSEGNSDTRTNSASATGPRPRPPNRWMWTDGSAAEADTEKFRLQRVAVHPMVQKLTTVQKIRIHKTVRQAAGMHGALATLMRKAQLQLGRRWQIDRSKAQPRGKAFACGDGW